MDLFAECKNTSRPVGFSQFNILMARVSRFSDRTNPCVMMISEGGFDEDFEEYARSTDVMLIGPDELYGRRPLPEIPLMLRE